MSHTLFNIGSLSTKNNKNFAEYNHQIDCYVKSENRNGHVVASTVDGNLEVMFGKEGPLLFAFDDVKIIYSQDQELDNRAAHSNLLLTAYHESEGVIDFPGEKWDYT